MSASSIASGRLIADGAGLFASIACAIHCAAMPLVIGYLPMLGLGWLADESFHQVMAGVCFLLALSAFLPGWRRHGSLAPAFVGSAGVALLAIAAFALEGECCPSCAASQETLPPEPAMVCTDEQCPHCVAAESGSVAQARSAADKASPTDQTPANAEQGEPVLAWATPFITPFGGLLLVAGHLVNHQKSCGCSCEACGQATEETKGV